MFGHLLAMVDTNTGTHARTHARTHTHTTHIYVDVVSLGSLLVVHLHVVGPVRLQLDGLRDLARMDVEVGVGGENRRSRGWKPGRDVFLFGAQGGRRGKDGSDNS